MAQSLSDDYVRTTEEQAKETVELCEKTDKQDTIIKSYQQWYDKLLAKKPEVEIEVYTEQANNGKYYAKGRFTDPTVSFPKETSQSQPVQSTGNTVELEAVGEAEEISLQDVPF